MDVFVEMVYLWGEQKSKWSERGYYPETIYSICDVTDYGLILTRVHLSALEKWLTM